MDDQRRVDNLNSSDLSRFIASGWAARDVDGVGVWEEYDDCSKGVTPQPKTIDASVLSTPRSRVPMAI